MIKDKKNVCILNENYFLFIVIILFIILCISYILIIPVFEAPDENWHFSYAFYLSKHNQLPSPYNEPVPIEQYIKENMGENSLNVFYMDDKYMFYSHRAGELWVLDKFLHPPLYYFISSQIIKPFGVDNIYMEDNFNQEHGINNKFIDNKILTNNSPTISLVLILRLFQIVYGVLIVFFIYKIIKLLSDDEFKNNSILLISGIAFLPQFVFLCSYINNDVLAALFGLVSVYFIVLLFKRDKAYLGLISILFAFIGGFTKYAILIMAPVVVIAFLIWLVIKKKKWALISVLAVIILSITAFYYIVNFKKASYEKTKIEAGWEESHKDKSVEDLNDVSVKNYALNLSTAKLVNFGNADILNVKNQSFTVELWIKSSTVQAAWRVLLGKNYRTSVGGWAISSFNDDTLYFNMLNTDAADYGFYAYRPAIINNEWVHAAWSCNRISPTTMEVSSYQNGNLLGTETRTDLTGTFSNELDTYLCKDLSETVAVDEVRIWNVARTQEQIQSSMYRELTGSEDGLVGYWNFNEGRGSTVYDSTVNKNNGTIFNIRNNLPPLLDRVIRAGIEMLTGFRDGKVSFNIDMPALTVTLKSTVAFFGWLNIAADKFIYNFFLAYVISGILVFFVNIRDYRKSKKSIIFIIVSIISIFSYFLLYAASTNWVQRQGRIIIVAVFLTYILAILGFKSIKASYRNILYYGLFASSLFISVFCLYNYIYLKYY